jgi:hypothetical protein
MHEGYLSKDRNRINAAQRARRARMTRVDYMPGPAALAIMEAKRARAYPGSVDATHSAVLDAILSEWAKMTGIKYGPKSKPMTSDRQPELSDHKRARANNFGLPIAPGRFAGAGAKDFGPIKQGSATRVPCGARRRRDGQPCQALSVPGKRRCKWHGGMSTGPKAPKYRTESHVNTASKGESST